MGGHGGNSSVFTLSSDSSIKELSPHKHHLAILASFNEYEVLKFLCIFSNILNILKHSKMHQQEKFNFQFQLSFCHCKDTFRWRTSVPPTNIHYKCYITQ